MHFILWTDASSARGEELVQQMEWLRSVIFGAAFPDLPPGGKTFVIALRDIHESRLYTPQYHDAFALARGPLHRPMIVLPADAYGDHFVITHELTHAISYGSVHHQPRWFAEGLATFFETIDLDMEQGKVDVGGLSNELRSALGRPGAILPTADLFSCEQIGCTDDYKFYVTAWTMYACLHYKHPVELARFERALDTSPARQAWGEAFPNLPSEALDHELIGWLMYGGYTIAHYKIEKRQWQIAERTLGEGDVHAVRGLLTWVTHPKAPEIDREIATALAVDTTNVIARILDAAVHDRKPDLTAARGVVAAHPDDYLAWLLLALASDPGDEEETAIAKLCALAARDPAILAPTACDKRG